MRPSAPKPNSEGFADRLGRHIAGYGARAFIEFERRWYTGDEITAYIDEVLTALGRAGVPPRAPIGLVARNRIPHAPLSVMVLLHRAIGAQSPVVDDSGLHILSSGTTGPPKKFPLPMDVLSHTVHTMTMGESGCHADPPELVY